MLQVTRIFHFEMAHAIHGYAGACRHIHGHSYELHVSARQINCNDDYLPASGFVMDFKELKQLMEPIIASLDHKLVLSGAYIKNHPGIGELVNLVAWEHEPSAENILTFIRLSLQKTLPPTIELHKLKIYETENSYAEWENNKN